MHNYIKRATSNLTIDELADFALIFQKRQKKERTAYALWLFGGFFGLHRFYTGNYGTALGLLAITVFTGGIGACFSLYDVVNVERLILNANKDVALQVVKEVKHKEATWQ